MRCHVRFAVALAALVLLVFVGAAWAQEPPAERAQEAPAEQADLPIIEFIYFDSASVEWAVSAEPERFQRHLATHPESQAFYNAVSSAVTASPQAENSAAQMTRWIESERERFDESRRETARIRMAEGITAYLRDHDFNIPKLVQALKRRSGAKDVELAVVHLRDRQGSSSFKLKVMLIDASINTGKQGFNIDLPSPNATYTTVVYALGLALYEVQEIIHGASPADGDDNRAIEQLPPPESDRAPTTSAR